MSLLGTGTLKAYAIPSSVIEPTLRCAIACFRSHLKGKLVATYWPPDRITFR